MSNLRDDALFRGVSVAYKRTSLSILEDHTSSVVYLGGLISVSSDVILVTLI
jgi:hypothetical protein